MDYIQVTITCLEEYREILIAELADIGFDSFLETDSGLEAFVSQEGLSREALDQLIDR
jgi:ribosomal protein L11 methyltransferase